MHNLDVDQVTCFVSQLDELVNDNATNFFCCADGSKVRVPSEDCKTLEEAVEKVEWDDLLTTIVLGKGEHKIDDEYLEIASAMNIVGDPGVPKEEIVVLGGIDFNRGIQGNCHLQHLTLRQAESCGVYGHSSFTMDDVLVEQCGWSGVCAVGTGVVGRCTNVEVRQCEKSGVTAMSDASITLIGTKTTVHHNCTRGVNRHYGLLVYGVSSTIQLVSPLTKEQVSLDNGGGGNWGVQYGGDINQIKTVSRCGVRIFIVVVDGGGDGGFSFPLMSTF